jgi:hypothetical protein
MAGWDSPALTKNSGEAALISLALALRSADLNEGRVQAKSDG